MPVRITERDKELLRFVAEHRLILASHVQALLDVSAAAAYARLRPLAGAGFLTQRMIFHRQPGCYQITRRGLAAIGSDLPVPRIDYRCYAHDVGAGWLWLAARAQKLGAVREVLSERRLRSEDASERARPDPHGVRLLGTGPAGMPRLHYPDLLLVGKHGHRIAVELELTLKGRARREKILAGYASDPRFHRVLYLTPDPRIASSVRSSAARLGISDLIRVQMIVMPGGAAPDARVQAAVRGTGRGLQPAARAAAR